MSTIRKSIVSLAARVTMRMARGPKLAVMTFHRVGEKYPINTDQIRDHLELLARYFEVVSPTQVIKSPSSHPMAMVTIDDSHQDIYDYIYPVALSLKVPITICVPTDFFLRQQWLWFDLVAWMHEQSSVGKEVEVEGQRYDLGDPESVVSLKRFLKRLLPLKRTSLITRIAKDAGFKIPRVPTDGYEAVTHPEMLEMQKSGLMEICAHSVTHTIATVLPDSALRSELTQCKSELEKFGGREIPSFCYPNGVTGDFDAVTTEAVRDAGFKMAMTSVMGSNNLKVTNPFLIRRVHAHASPDIFEKNISSLIDLKRRFLKSDEL